MTAIAALAPPAAPRTPPASNVMQFQLERRASAGAAVAAVREAAGTDPRAALRLAHEERAEAEADVSRLTDVLGRARQHHDAIAVRLRAAETAVQHHDSAAAAGGLIAALSANASPVAVLEDGEAAKATRLTRETAIASAAVDRLGAELAEAQERPRIAIWRVRALALARLEIHGIKTAEAMLVEQKAMRLRRDRLGDLQALLTTEARAVYGDAVSPPTAISNAVAAADPPRPWRSSSPYAPRAAEPPNPWSEAFRRLLADPEAALGEVSE